MSLDLRALLADASCHAGIVTERDLARFGITLNQRRRLVADGLLCRVLDGSYRIASSPEDELARCVSVCARPSGLIVAAPTAGRIWRWRRMPNDALVWVLAPPRSNPTVEPWVRAYRTAAISPSDVVRRSDGIVVTSPPRTAVDLARHLSDEDLRSVIDQLRHEGTCSLATLRRVAEPLATPGRPWARRFLGVLDRIPEGKAPESHWESRVFDALRQRGIDVEAQRWLDVPAFGPIRLDACITSLRWGVEVDVHPEHFTEAGGTRDRERDLACHGIDWQIHRVARLTLERSFDNAMDTLAASARRRRARVLEHAGLQP